MALSIGVSKGSKLTVGDIKLEVLDHLHGEVVYISCEYPDKSMKKYTVGELERVEIGPEIYVFCGKSSSLENINKPPRLAFEADRSVIIKRVDKTSEHHH